MRHSNPANPTDLVSAKWAPGSSFYEKRVLGILTRMSRGKLRLTLPGGEEVEFGERGNSGSEATAHIRVVSSRFFKRCILYGDVGFGESFVDGDWETDSVLQVIRWMILNRDENPGITGSKVSSAAFGALRGMNRLVHALRGNDVEGSRRNISAHYDLSNELFSSFLDESMTYSCADFSGGAETLEEAQIAKFDRLARAIQARPGDHVLEIGGGWGAFAIYLARRYGCRVTSITVSREQHKLMRERVKAAGLDELVEARFQDYRSVDGRFDKVVSVEMLEAVGHRQLSVFFGVVEKVLKPQGLLEVQVITSADSRYERVRRQVDWTQKHIFPGSLIPSLGALSDAARAASAFQMHSLHDLGPDYARTLAEWRRRFNASRAKVQALGFDERFVRAWNYYFSYCEAAFATRHISAVQIVYTRPNNFELTGGR
jgi:cyclopropane-fatty-acyl-phospholipid synthase